MGESGGGPPRSVGQLCGTLAEHVEVRIVSHVRPSDKLVALSPAVQLDLVPTVQRSIANLRGSPEFGQALQQISAQAPMDLWHQHGLWLRVSHQTTAFAHQNKIPLVLSPRGMLEPWALNSKKWKKKLAWLLYQKRDLQRVTAFHATAHSEAESIRRLGFKQPIAVIPNGVVLPDVAGSAEHGAPNPSLQAPSSMPHALNATPHAPSSLPTARTALFLSRINPKKGLPMLLDAWAKVAPADWRLVIVGNDDANHLPVVERKIRELGLTDRVTIAGALFGKAKEEAYKNADLFVLPSFSENFGIVVTEALGYGLPVLTTTGCPWQELQTHHCGWWVEPTVAGLESGLQAALGAGSEERRAMGLRGRKLVEENYQWPGIAEKMLAFYKWILNGGKKPEFVV